MNMTALATSLTRGFKIMIFPATPLEKCVDGNCEQRTSDERALFLLNSVEINAPMLNRG